MTATFPAGCPDDETLAAYLEAVLPKEEDRRIEAHVLGCDSCVLTLSGMQHRLQRAREIATPVPAAVMERASAAADPPARLRRPKRRPRHQVPLPLRLPILLPAAFAAGALLFIGIHSGRLLLATRTELSRGAAEPARSRRLTQSESLARVEPNPGAAAVASVPADVAVEVEATEHGWSRVVLRDGRHAWLPPQAFE